MILASTVGVNGSIRSQRSELRRNVIGVDSDQILE